MRRGADQHTIGFGCGLKACRQVGRVADDGLLSGGANAGCFAGNDEPGRNSHAALQRQSVRPLQPSDLLDGFKTGPDRQFGCVLQRQRKAKIHQYSVAQILRDISVIFADRGNAGVPILAQQADEVFGIQLASERGRAHEIDEYDGDLAALDQRRGLTWAAVTCADAAGDEAVSDETSPRPSGICGGGRATAPISQGPARSGPGPPPGRYRDLRGLRCISRGPDPLTRV